MDYEEWKQQAKEVATNPISNGEWVDVAALGNQLNAELKAERQSQETEDTDYQ